MTKPNPKKDPTARRKYKATRGQNTGANRLNTPVPYGKYRVTNTQKLKRLRNKQNIASAKKG